MEQRLFEAKSRKNAGHKLEAKNLKKNGKAQMFGIFESMIRILDTRFTASATQIFADFCGAKQHGDTICGLDRRIFCRGPCCDDLLLVSTTSTMSVVSFWFSPPLMRCLIHTARGSHPVVLSVAKCSSVSRDFAGVYF